MKYMLDTNICIYTIKNKPDNVLRNFKRHYTEGLCISSITLAELTYGVYKSKNQDQNMMSLYNFLSIIDVLSFDHNAAYEYGLIRADLETNGTPIGANDYLIAAHAKALDLTLVTNNTKEFSDINDLKLDHWV